MLITLLGLVPACVETDEMRDWKSRRHALELELAELSELEANRVDRAAQFEKMTATLSALRNRIDLVARLRSAAVPGVTMIGGNVQFEGTVEACRDALRALGGETRKLVPYWSLRIENGKCRWNAMPLQIPEKPGVVAAVWTAPPTSFASSGMAELRASVFVLETKVAAKRTALGKLADWTLMNRTIHDAELETRLLEERATPCDLAVIERAVVDDSASLLEVQVGRLVHPLEPLSDVRLKRLVEVHDGALTWKCAGDE